MKPSIRSIRKHLVLVASATALALACATAPKPSLVARPSANQQVIYEDGAEKIISMRPGSIVSLRVGEPTAGRSAFVLGVANQMSYPVVIAPEMVTVFQSGRSLRVFPYEEVARLEREKRDRDVMVKTLLGGLSAGMSMGGYSSNLSLASAQNSLQGVQQALSMSASQRETTLKEMASTALKKNTLFPTQQAAGVVYAEKLGVGPIQVRVQISEDIHDFEFGL